jgi:hypothetical protein
VSGAGAGYCGGGEDKMKEKAASQNKLPTTLKLALFISSYFPLFLIIILKQIDQNRNYLSFGGLSIQSLKVFFFKFGVSVVLSFVSLFGILGIFSFIKDMRDKTDNNCDTFNVHDVQNKNTESIGYIATYVLPFVFQSYSSVFEIIELFVLLAVMYIIYAHSTLIVVNPLLNIRYSLYEIDYSNIKSPDRITHGVFIVNTHYLCKGDTVKGKRIQGNIFYALTEEDNDE